MSAGIIRVGVSGWTYPEWRGAFYPKGLKREHELHYAASVFPTIEINGTFYGQQRPEIFSCWAAQVQPHVLFAVKAPRFITHIQRLRHAEAPLANFLASGLLRLGPHLGPILWQMPRNYHFRQAELEAFLQLLPHDTRSAARLGQRHDKALRSPPALEVDANRPIRHALEVRHDSFRTEAFVALLRAHHVALVCSDAGAWPRFMDVTADFVYCRLHGAQELYASNYDGAALADWAERFRVWAEGGNVPAEQRIAGPASRRRRDVFVYFDNTMKVAAPANAQELMRRLRT
jgi:uncharacterized protein YecE (DUF72 family)